MTAATGADVDHSNNNTSEEQGLAQLEHNVDDFVSWKQEDDFKNILPNVCVHYNKKVTVEMVSDPVAWNITNLRRPLDWELPTETVAPGAKVQSVIWIQLFKSYVMKYMKAKVRCSYLRLFNSEKYRALRGDRGGCFNYREMCCRLSPFTCQSVSNCILL